MIDVEAVKSALRATAILDAYGEQYHDRPEIRLARCPACGHQSRRGRESFVVDGESGDWIHHGGARADGTACRGNVLGLVAAFAGLDIRRDFPRVLEIAASIAGITPDTNAAELARIRAEREAAREARDRRAAAERAQGETMVPALWEALDRRHLRGERYLADRGLTPAALRQAGDVVRFYPEGSPAVRLYSLDSSEPINIIRRQIDREPKILSLDLGEVIGADDVVGTFSTLGTLVGRVTDIDPDGVDVAVLLEGMTDSLAALLAFPTCAVGWRMMPRVAAAIAPRLVAAGAWLLVAVDDDEQGVAGAGDAMRAAVDAGLVLDESVRAIELGAHHDLADAWRAGWRWTWPNLTGKPGGAA